MEESPFLARSARPDREAQLYVDHIVGVRERSRDYLYSMQAFIEDKIYQRMRTRLLQAADKHDLGKLITENQQVLRQASESRLAVPHEDAGSRYFFKHGDHYAAALVYGHHLPGLPDCEEKRKRRFPFCRAAEREEKKKAPLRLDEQHFDRQLEYCLKAHERALGLHCLKDPEVLVGQKSSTLEMRFLLSMLVNADWDDAARKPLQVWASPHWEERLQALKAYAGSLGSACGVDDGWQSERNALRTRLFEACLAAAGEGLQDAQGADAAGRWLSGLRCCGAPVGMGKTLALLAYALQRAVRGGFRHVFVILPYTSLLNQVENVLRESVVLDGEDFSEVVGVVHHRVEYDDDRLKGAALGWTTPIVLTTAVQFYETLASNKPARLKKLHNLPGSAIVLDEFDSSLPPKCLPLAWHWLSDLVDRWGCNVAVSSGTLVKFWENGKFIKTFKDGKEGRLLAQPVSLVCPNLMKDMESNERARVRVRYRSVPFSDMAELASFVGERLGPRVVMMDTRESAARMAEQLRGEGSKVLHLSNALAPRDCARILEEVKKRLGYARMNPESPAVCDWTLVSTTYAGIGLDLSFRTGFMRAFSCSSLLQLSGRISRSFEYPDADLWVFELNDPKAPLQVRMKATRDILIKMLKEGVDGKSFSECFPVELATYAFQQEYKNSLETDQKNLLKNERNFAFETLAKDFKVIQDDEALMALVDDDLVSRILDGGLYSPREIQTACVSLRDHEVQRLETKGLSEVIEGAGALYRLPSDSYDADLLGYFKSLLDG